MKESLLVRACRRQPVERTPIWVMRQAGRYLPEYNDVRSKTSFLGLCKTPELAAEVTLQPLRRFPLDAAIIFSDILVPVEAMGVGLDYAPGPKLDRKITTAHDVEGLRVPDPQNDMGFVLDAIRTFKREKPDLPLLGFAGAPFTLAAYMVEGAGSKDFHPTKALLYREPRTARALLQKLTDTVSAHLEAQIEAGADAVQIFDSWAGALSKTDFMDFALPFMATIVERLQPKGVPIIAFAKGAHASLDELSRIGADVVGVDWTTPLDVAGAQTGDRVALQGNLDPAVLFSTPERIEREVQRILSEAKGLPGHVFNLGHGILPKTPPENMAALVDAVQRLGRRRAKEHE